MKTAEHNDFVLSDQETLVLLEGFCYEALRFLKVSVEQYPMLRIGVSMDRDGRANPLSINYSKSKVLVFIPIIRMMFTPLVGNDAPTLFRMLGYLSLRAQPCRRIIGLEMEQWQNQSQTLPCQRLACSR